MGQPYAEENNRVDIFCRLSTMYERGRQTNRPLNSKIDNSAMNNV